jgi:hypothetical protein
MKFILTGVPSASFNFLPLRSKYFPQHPFYKNTEGDNSPLQIYLVQRGTVSGTPVVLIHTGLILPVARRSRYIYGR